MKQCASVASFRWREPYLECPPTHMADKTDKADKTVQTTQPQRIVATSQDRLGVSFLRIQLGATLQKHRAARGMTQSELAEYVQLSLKYIGEIERGEANTTLEVLERLSRAVGWDPMESLEGLNDPLSEGVRVLLLEEVQQMADRLRNMARWLHALDPALQPPRPTIPVSQPTPPKRVRRGRKAQEGQQTAGEVAQAGQAQGGENQPQAREEPRSEPAPEAEPPCRRTGPARRGCRPRRVR